MKSCTGPLNLNISQ